MPYAGPVRPSYDEEYYRRTGQQRPLTTFGDVMRTFDASRTAQPTTPAQSYSSPQPSSGGWNWGEMQQYYQGWPEGAAKQNFQSAFGGDVNRLRQARGFSSGGGSTGYSAPDPAALARQMLDLQKEANKPAIQALEGQLPTIGTAYGQRKTALEGEKAPLEQRYQTLLNQLTSREKKETQDISTSLSREYGRRGIGLGGNYEQALQQKLEPRTEYWKGAQEEASQNYGAGTREIANALAMLPTQQSSEEQQVRQAIAQLSSGAASSGVQQALQLYQMQQQAQEQALTRALQERIANMEAAGKNYVSLGEGSTLYNLLSGKPMYTAPKSYKTEAVGDIGADYLADYRKRNLGTDTSNRYSLVP